MAGADFLNNSQREMLLVCRRCDDKSDLSGSCRICLTYLHSSEMTQIFPSISTDSWKTLIKSVVNVEVNAGDGLPALVCSLCVSKLNHAKEFKEKSVAADILLRSALFQDDKALVLSADTDAALPRVSQRHDSSGLCRLCAASFASGDSTPIFHDKGLDSLPGKIASVTSVKVAVGDGLPARICDCCVAKLRRVSEFVEDAGAMDLYLRTELFQVKREVCDLQVPDLPLEPDWKPQVKQEPDEPVCETAFGARNVIENHLPCRTQPRRAKRTKRFARGVKSRRKDRKPLPCPFCTKTYLYKDGILRHFLAAHKFKEQPFKCSQCRLVFLCQASLDEHELYDHREKSFQCGTCEKTFPTKLLCARHITTHPEVKSDLEKTIQCALCEKKFWSNSRLKAHMSIHVNVKSFKCMVCGKRLKSLIALELHEATHATDSPYKCELCDKYFQRKQAWSLHMASHSNEKPFACKICDRRYHRQIHLTNHETMHSDARPYPCVQCGKRFKARRNLSGHLKKHSDSSVGCAECGTVLATLISYSKHLKRRNPDRPLECNVCEKSFAKINELISHMKTHEDRVKRVPCRNCKRALATHLAKQKQRSKPFKCEHCLLRYHEKSALKAHIFSVHVKETKHECSVCDKVFTYKRGLVLHMMHHTGKKPYRCGVCEKTLSSMASVRIHVATHMEDRHFQCEQCGKTFKHRSCKQSHIKSQHTHVKLYECVACDKKFKQKSRFVGHVRSHTEPKPFVCAVCGKGLGRADSLKEHMTTHSDERSHGCAECDEFFKTKRDARKHYLQTHASK